MLLGVTWRLESVSSVIVAGFASYLEIMGDSPLCNMTLTDYVLSFPVSSCMSKYKLLVLLLSCTS